MALTVQDDTGAVAGANGYISVDYFLEYHEEVGNTLSRDEQDEDKVAAAIVRASRHIDIVWGPRFPGRRLTASQATLWPRADVVNDEVPPLPITGLPLGLRQATAELTLVALRGPLTLGTTPTAATQVVKSVREKVGPLEEETTYETGATVPVSVQPTVALLLRPLLARAQAGGLVYR